MAFNKLWGLMCIFSKLRTSCYLHIMYKEPQYSWEGLKILFAFPNIKLKLCFVMLVFWCTVTNQWRCTMLQTLRRCPSGTWVTLCSMTILRHLRVKVRKDMENAMLIAAPPDSVWCDGKRRLVVIRGNQNSERYQDNILQQLGIPHSHSLRWNSLLQDDNALHHRTSFIRKCLQNLHGDDGMASQQTWSKPHFAVGTTVTDTTMFADFRQQCVTRLVISMRRTCLPHAAKIPVCQLFNYRYAFILEISITKSTKQQSMTE